MFPNDILLSAAGAMGLTLTAAQTALFAAYTEILLEWNRRMNLTAITEPEEIVIKHYADSLSLPAFVPLPESGSVMDVGAGAGFPGIPLKICRPDLRVTLLDSQAKRISFLKAAGEALGLPFETLELRAEQAGRMSGLRERFDLVTARAVAGLPVLCELCMPLVKPGGIFVAMKGPKAAAELEQSAHAVSELGGEIQGIKEVKLPDGSERALIIIKKRTQTPTRYPRANAKIQKSPL